MQLLDPWSDKKVVLTKQTASEYLDKWVFEYDLILKSDNCSDAEKVLLFIEKLVQLKPLLPLLDNLQREFTLEELLGPNYFKGV